MSMIGNFLQLSSDELESLIADPSSVEAFIYPDDEEHENNIDVDKAWHGIHFLLAGDAWGGEPPLANVVLGGTEIGDDVGYGPARYLTVEEVESAARALKDITPELKPEPRERPTNNCEFEIPERRFAEGPMFKRRTFQQADPFFGVSRLVGHRPINRKTCRAAGLVNGCS